ncbi:MAG: sodium:calcium antiporter, partial [Chloroflexota bacterium]
LVAGWIVAQTGDALAGQTGLGGTFIGFTLVAISTSLPELSTTTTAARFGAYGLAVSNIFGSNAFDTTLLFVADVAYRQGPVLAAVERWAVFAAALGILVTCVYLWGLVERRDRTILGMGIDSALVLALYLSGLFVLYILR